MKTLLTALTALALTVITAGTAAASLPTDGQLPEGTIIVIGPFPLDIVDTRAVAAPVVVDMSADWAVDLGAFTVDLDSGAIWLSDVAAQTEPEAVIEMEPLDIVVDLHPQVIEMEPLAIVVDRPAAALVVAAR